MVKYVAGLRMRKIEGGEPWNVWNVNNAMIDVEKFLYSARAIIS